MKRGLKFLFFGFGALLMLNSFLFLAFGILLILNSFHGLTGFTVIEKIGEVQGSVFGALSILVGVFLILIARLDKKIKNLKLKNNKVINLFENYKN